MDVKRRGDVVKIRLTQEDLKNGMADAILYPVLSAVARNMPEMVLPLESFTIEMAAPMIITLTASPDPAALFKGGR